MTARLLSVQFDEDHTIWRDGPGSQVDYISHWRDDNQDGDAFDFDDGDDRAPIAYTINDLMPMSAVSIVVTPADAFNPATATIIGSVNGVDVFFGTDCWSQTVGSRWIVTSTDFTGSMAAPATIDFWDETAISWRLRVQPGFGLAFEVSAGSSTHDFYFVLQDPGPQAQYYWYYTLVDLACRGAKGLDGSDHGAIADAIFAEFSDREVFRAQDILEDPNGAIPLKYYGDWLTGYTSIKDLLGYGDGQCGAWAQMFLGCLHVAGIDPANEYIAFQYDYPPGPNGPQAAIVVKAWTFPGSSNPDPETRSDYPHLNIPVLPFIPDDWGVGNSYECIWEDAIDLIGVAGQNQSDPSSIFGNHQVIRVENKLYDPSYGDSYIVGGVGGNSILSNIDSAMAGYALGFLGVNNGLSLDEVPFSLDFNGDGDEVDLGVLTPCIVFMGNPAGNQLRLSSGFPQNRSR